MTTVSVSPKGEAPSPNGQTPSPNGQTPASRTQPQRAIGSGLAVARALPLWSQWVLQAALQRLGVIYRWLRRRFWPGAPSLLALLVIAAVCIAIPFVLTDVFGIHFWRRANVSCGKNGLVCELGVHVVGTVIVGVLAYYLIFLRRETRAAVAWRYRARKQPRTLFPWLPEGIAPPASTEATPWSWATDLLSRAWFRVITGQKRQASYSEEIIGRADLAKEIAEDLDEDVGPQIVVGATGSGKSTLLVQLARCLAKRGQVPVPVLLRDEKSLDFEELAREAYRRAAVGRYAEDTDKQWAWLRRRHLITVLVDNLEKSDVTIGKRVSALELARQRKLRLVVATRPDGIPSGYKRGRIDLESLDTDKVVDDIEQRLERADPARSQEGQSSASHREQAAHFVESVRPDKSPYYLTLASPLADRDCLPDYPDPKKAPTDRNKARVELFERYFSALADRTLMPEAGLPPETRQQVLVGLEAIAYFRVLNVRKIRDLAEAVTRLDDWPRDGLDVWEVIDGGSRLGILNESYDNTVHFNHQTTLAYFASRFIQRLRPADPLWISLFGQEWITPSATATLILAAAGTNDRRLAIDASAALMARVYQESLGMATPTKRAHNDGTDERKKKGKRVRDQRDANPATAYLDRLSLIGSAAAMLAGLSPPDGSSVDLVIRRFEAERSHLGRAPVAEKLVLQAIAKLNTSSSNRLLWRMASDAEVEYAVRREAIRSLAHGDKDALLETAAQIEECAIPRLDTLEAMKSGYPDDREEPLLRLKAVAMLLPTVRSAAPQSVKARLAELESRLGLLARAKDMQRGLEGSLAQGLKLDAVCNPEARVDSQALLMARKGKFWFSRLLALQAIAIRAAEAGGNDPVRLIVQAAKHDPHPFVCAGAALCDRTLDPHRRHPYNWRRYIWTDMTEVAAGSPQGLSPRATRLVGDVILALNLNEQDQDRELRKHFGASRRLPYCLSASSHRHEILGSVDAPGPKCVRHMECSAPLQQCYCPYAYEYAVSSNAHRELSRAFCRHQRIHAKPLRWQPNISVRRLKQFWEGMENLARF